MQSKRSATKIITSMLVVVITAGSCQPVKEYQKQHLNYAEMELSSRKVQKFETPLIRQIDASQLNMWSSYHSKNGRTREAK